MSKIIFHDNKQPISITVTSNIFFSVSMYYIIPTVQYVFLVFFRLFGRNQIHNTVLFINYSNYRLRFILYIPLLR